MERHEEIKALRKKAGLSIHQAAQLCHVNDRTWGRWEAGDRRMPEGALELFKIKAEGRAPIGVERV